MFDRLEQLLIRISAINPLEILAEMAVIWLVVWLIFRFLQGTRGARMLKGVGVLLIITTMLLVLLGGEQQVFQRLKFLLNGSVLFAGLALVVVFQPELRRALVRLGEARLFRGQVTQVGTVVDEIVRAVAYLSRNKIGAIIAVEREVPLGGIVESGTPLNAEVTAELIETIFWPGSALHDMGMVIQNDTIAAAGVQFPLAEGDELGQELGSRHRAAVGLSQECDALVIVVSEETGSISLAERGRLIRKLSTEGLASLLRRELMQTVVRQERQATAAADGPADSERPKAEADKS